MLTKKDIFILLCPSVAFVAIIVAALICSRGLQTFDTNAERESQQKFEAFARKVEAGESQLTQGQMLEGMRNSRAVAESERRVVSITAHNIRNFCWLAAAGIFLQFGTVIAVKRTRKK